MLASVEHRGRDDSGTWVSEPIDSSGRRACLGHRRLAIIDTSPGGHEPMFSHDGRYVLTFNGEIYNYRELREQLRSLGHQFQNRQRCGSLVGSDLRVGLGCSDTSQRHVCVRRLGQQGTHVDAGSRSRRHQAALLHFDSRSERCAGDISFRLRDQSDTCVRTDQARTRSGSVAPVPDISLVARSEYACLQTSKQFHPVTCFNFTNDEIKLTQWWDVSFDEIEEGKNEAWWRERVLETLDRVVKMEMVADVPLGSFLSGGIDSSGSSR